jgi:hypothetical protein
VNVVDELLALLERDAAQGDPVGAPTVELPVDKVVVLGAPYQAFCHRVVVLQREASLEVVPDLVDPPCLLGSDGYDKTVA